MFFDLLNTIDTKLEDAMWDPLLNYPSAQFLEYSSPQMGPLEDSLLVWCDETDVMLEVYDVF